MLAVHALASNTAEEYHRRHTTQPSAKARSNFWSVNRGAALIQTPQARVASLRRHLHIAWAFVTDACAGGRQRDIVGLTARAGRAAPASQHSEHLFGALHVVNCICAGSHHAILHSWCYIVVVNSYDCMSIIHIYDHAHCVQKGWYSNRCTQLNLTYVISKAYTILYMLKLFSTCYRFPFVSLAMGLHTYESSNHLTVVFFINWKGITRIGSLCVYYNGASLTWWVLHFLTFSILNSSIFFNATSHCKLTTAFSSRLISWLKTFFL